MGRYIDFLLHLDHSIACEAGQFLFRQGDLADYMYIVKTGAVMVKVDDKPIDLFRPGEIVGEMALVGKTTRCGTAKAVIDSTLVVIDSARFETLMSDSPLFVRELMETMALRVRRMNKEILMLNRVLLRSNIQHAKHTRHSAEQRGARRADMQYS